MLRTTFFISHVRFLMVDVECCMETAFRFFYFLRLSPFNNVLTKISKNKNLQKTNNEKLVTQFYLSYDQSLFYQYAVISPC